MDQARDILSDVTWAILRWEIPPEVAGLQLSAPIQESVAEDLLDAGADRFEALPLEAYGRRDPKALNTRNWHPVLGELAVPGFVYPDDVTQGGHATRTGPGPLALRAGLRAELSVERFKSWPPAANTGGNPNTKACFPEEKPESRHKTPVKNRTVPRNLRDFY